MSGMVERQPPGAGPDPSLWWTLRGSMSALFDDFGKFFVANALWCAAGGAALLLGSVYLLANALLIVLVPATAGLGRLATMAARGHPARLRHFRDGLTARWPFAPLLGVAQFALGAVGWVNVQVGFTAATLPLVAAAVAAFWLLLAVATSAVAVWPLLLDPDRDAVPTRQLVRLALGVVVIRPGRVVLVVTFGVVMGIVSLQAMVAALVLPSVGVLFAAHAVIPVADRLAGTQPA